MESELNYCTIGQLPGYEKGLASRTSNIKLLYVRYSYGFLIFLCGTKAMSHLIRSKIIIIMNKNGLSLSTENLVISNTAEGFTFLGAICKRVRKTSRMSMDVDSYKIYRKLVEENLARFSNHSSIIPQGTANNYIINLPHAEIVKFYNFKIRELISYYSFVSSRQKLKDIIWLVYRSCALTLVKKYKLSSPSTAIKKFGRSLECPNTGVKLYMPNSLAINSYQSNFL